MSKTEQEIIKYLEENKETSVIFQLALSGMKDYKLPLDVIFKHIIIYQENLIRTYRKNG